MSVEATSGNLQRSGTEPCRVQVIPLVNGNEWGGASLVLSAFAPSGEAPSGVVPAAGTTSPIGLTANGTTQTMRQGDRRPRCSSSSQVTVAVAVTQQK